MSITAMILAGDRTIVDVRDDAMENRVACVACKGRGELWFRLGGERAVGTFYRQERCPECGGAGTWQEKD